MTEKTRGAMAGWFGHSAPPTPFRAPAYAAHCNSADLKKVSLAYPRRTPLYICPHPIPRCRGWQPWSGFRNRKSNHSWFSSVCTVQRGIRIEQRRLLAAQIKPRLIRAELIHPRWPPPPSSPCSWQSVARTAARRSSPAPRSGPARDRPSSHFSSTTTTFRPVDRRAASKYSEPKRSSCYHGPSNG